MTHGQGRAGARRSAQRAAPKQAATPERGIRFGEFELAAGGSGLLHRGVPVPLEPKVLQFLSYLVRHRERIVPRDELFTRIWPGIHVGDAALTTCAHRLRRALGAHGAELIQSHYGRGYQFTGACEFASESPTPRTAPPIRRQPFVARDEERALLTEAWQRSAASQGHLVILEGEQGIGKSALVMRFLDEAPSEAALAAIGRCLDADGAPPYLPWSEVITACLSELGADAAHACLNRAGNSFDPLLQSGTGPAVSHQIEDPEHARFRLFRSAAALLRDVATFAPLVLVIEDLHWADRATMLLLEFVARQLEDTRILIVATHRPPGPQSPGWWIEALNRLRSLPRCIDRTLRPLSERAAEQLLRELAQAKIVDAVGDELCRRAEGSPFFLENLVRHVSESFHDANATGDLQRLLVQVPDRIHLVVAERLHRLSPECLEMLAIAATIGRRFRVSLLARVRAKACAAESREVTHGALRELDEAASSRIVAAVDPEGTEYQFTHALFREAIYQGIGLAERCAHHLRIGEELAREPQPLLDSLSSELAFHYFHGAMAGGAQEAVSYCARDADAAQRQFAFETATDRYCKALEALRIGGGDARREAELSIRLATCMCHSGPPDRARAAALRAATIARELRDSALLGEAALAITGAPMFVWKGDNVVGVSADMMNLLEEVYAQLSNGDNRDLRARIASRLAWAGYFARRPLEFRDRLSREALELADNRSGIVTALNVLAERHIAITAPGRTAERTAISDQLEELARGAGAPDHLANALQMRALDRLEAGNIAGADADMEEYGRLATELGHPRYRWIHGLWSSLRATMSGDLDRGEEAALAAAQDGAACAAPSRTVALQTHFATRLLIEHRHRDLIPPLQLVLQQTPYLGVARALLALAHAELGESDEAHLEASRLIDDGWDELPFDSTWLPIVALLGAAEAKLGNGAAAREIHRRLEPYAASHIVIGSEATSYCGSVALPLAQLAEALGWHNKAERYFRAAITAHDAVGALPWAARARIDFGRMLRARDRTGDHERARDLFSQARRITDTLGLPNLAQRIASPGT